MAREHYNMSALMLHLPSSGFVQAAHIQAYLEYCEVIIIQLHHLSSCNNFCFKRYISFTGRENVSLTSKALDSRPQF